MTRRRISAFVEALLRDRRPPSFRADPSDADAMRAAINLRAHDAEAASPSPEFVQDLHDQLRRDLDEQPHLARGPRPALVSRRWVLEGAAVAAAAGVGIVIDREALAPSHHTTASSSSLVPTTGDWQPVASRAALAAGQATRFDGPGAVGFISEQRGTLLAVSGVCTHQGCLLQLDQTGRQLDCPCHRTAFALSGDVLFSQLSTRPAPLPRLEVRDRNGKVEVFVPRPL